MGFLFLFFFLFVTRTLAQDLLIIDEVKKKKKSLYVMALWTRTLLCLRLPPHEKQPAVSSVRVIVRR